MAKIYAFSWNYLVMKSVVSVFVICFNFHVANAVSTENSDSKTKSLIAVKENVIPVPEISADGPTSFCSGESVTLTSSNAASYLWSPNGETTQTIVVTESGTYSVSIIDNEGFEASSSPVTVTVYDIPIPLINNDGPLTFCPGESVTLTSSEAASYLWLPGSETTQSITVSASGTFRVVVNDLYGCRGTSEPVTIIANSSPLAFIYPDESTTLCEGGSITFSSSEAAFYLWSPYGETTQSIIASQTGDYSVTLTDANGCAGISSTVHLDVMEAIDITVSSSGSLDLCQGESVTLTASAPNAADFQWFRNGVPVQGSIGASITVSDFADYYVEVINQTGCIGNSQVQSVRVSPIPTAYLGMDEVICVGESVVLTASGGEAFLWSTGETTQSILISPTESSNYFVNVTNPYCNQMNADTVNVSVAEFPLAVIQASENPSLGNPVNFVDNSADNSIVNWYWDFGDGSDAAMQNSNHTYDAEGIYTVILKVENQYGCAANDTLEVNVTQIIIIPNSITPNGDGINDVLGVKNNGVDEYTLSIFNRFGQIVYESEKREINWDGKSSSGVELSGGTYFYVLDVKNSGTLGNFEKRGFITLIR